jgi:hypothetical protein
MVDRLQHWRGICYRAADEKDTESNHSDLIYEKKFDAKGDGTTDSSRTRCTVESSAKEPC